MNKDLNEVKELFMSTSGGKVYQREQTVQRPKREHTPCLVGTTKRLVVGSERGDEEKSHREGREVVGTKSFWACGPL